MLIWVMFDCRYKLDQIGTSWYKLEGAKEKKKGAGPQSNRLDWHPVDWIGTSSRLDSSAEIPELKIDESNQLDGDPGDWINCPESGRYSKLQFRVNWIVIQVTGLINPNQAESPGGISIKIQSTGWCSRRLDLREISFKESTIVF